MRPLATELLQKKGYGLNPHGKGFYLIIPEHLTCPACAHNQNYQSNHQGNKTQVKAYPAAKLDSIAVMCYGTGGKLTYRELCDFLQEDITELPKKIRHKQYTLQSYAAESGFPAEHIETAPLELRPYVKKDTSVSKVIQEFLFKYPCGTIHRKTLQAIPFSNEKASETGDKTAPKKLKKIQTWVNRDLLSGSLWFHRAPIENPSEGILYILEGETDALALGQYGLASIGVPGNHAFTAASVKWLRKTFKEYKHWRFCFDFDKAGKAGTRQAVKLSASEFGIKIEQLAWPGEFSGTDIKDIRGLTTKYKAEAIRLLLEKFAWVNPYLETINNEPKPEKDSNSDILIDENMRLFDGIMPEPHGFGDVRWFLHFHRQDILFPFNLKTPPYYVWTQQLNKWIPDTNHSFIGERIGSSLRLLGQYAYQMIEADPEEKHNPWARRTALTHKRVADVLALARHRPEIRIDSAELDTHPHLIPFRNGTYNIITKEFTEPNRENLMTRACPVTYEASAKCPLWLEFLDKIFQKDSVMIFAIQELVGYALTGYASEQGFYIFYGMGANGKSTFIETIRQILGPDFAVQMQVGDIMQKRFGSDHSDHLARLEGSRLATIKEPQENHILDDSTVKLLSDDTPLTARGIYSSTREFPATWTSILLSNHKPGLASIDDALKRRIHLIPFEVVIPATERDPNLKDKLRKEIQGIINWCLEGASRWFAHRAEYRIPFPNKVKAATDEYFDAYDPVKTFISQLCYFNPTMSVSFRDIFRIFNIWRECNSERPYSKRKFSERLQTLGESWHSKFHHTILRDTNKGFQGISLRSANDPQMREFIESARRSGLWREESMPL